MVDRSQHYSNTEADPAGALADRSKGEIRRAIVRPHRTEVMFGKPHARKALLLGVGNLIQGLVDALRLAGGGPGLGNLNLVEQADPHRIASLPSAKEEPDFHLIAKNLRIANPTDQLPDPFPIAGPVPWNRPVSLLDRVPVFIAT